MSPDAYCLDQVRRDDPDRYWTLLLTAPAYRPRLAALYAFNQEIAKTRETVSDPMVGEIRLQWWREAIAEAADGRPRGHPVVRALSAHQVAVPARRDALTALVDARSPDLFGEAPKDFEGLLAYADATGGGVSRLAVALCGAGDAAAGPAGQVGRAWALVGLIRAFGFHNDVRRANLPDEALRAAGVEPQTVYRGAFDPALKPLFTAIANAARQALDTASAGAAAVDRQARPPLLLATMAGHYLSALDKADGDPLRAAFERGRLALLARLYIRALRGRY